MSTNWVSDLVEAYGGIPGTGCRANNNADVGSGQAADLIVADQRDSRFGDINAGTMLFRVSDWSLRFLDAWWNHPLAQQVETQSSHFAFLNELSTTCCKQGDYEQRVFNVMWFENELEVRSHTSLVPMLAMNAHPGVWWPNDGASPAPHVVHLMQVIKTRKHELSCLLFARK